MASHMLAKSKRWQKMRKYPNKLFALQVIFGLNFIKIKKIASFIKNAKKIKNIAHLWRRFLLKIRGKTLLHVPRGTIFKRFCKNAILWQFAACIMVPCWDKWGYLPCQGAYGKGVGSDAGGRQV